MMEIFVTKLRFEGGIHSDPMLEEKGGVDSGETWRHDTKMEDVVMRVIVKASQQALDNALNPFGAKIGEILLNNFERNFSGFLVRKDAIPFNP